MTDRRNPWTGRQMQNCGVCSECLGGAENAELQTENSRLTRWLRRIEAAVPQAEALAHRALKGDLP